MRAAKAAQEGQALIQARKASKLCGLQAKLTGGDDA